LVLCFGEYETTGFEIDEILSDKYGIDIEMADLLNIVLIVTPSNTVADLQALYDALADITRNLEKRKENVKILPPPIFEDVISPQNAFFGDTKIIPLDNSIGEISAAAVTAYPPGIPIIYAGAKITENQLAYIKYLRQLGAEITGADGDMIEVLINRERI
jgi:lysine decarboxylase